MTSDRTFRVEVVRSGDWWAITVPELAGVFSQAKRLDQVEDHAREAIAMMLDLDEGDVERVEIHVTHPDVVADILEAFNASVEAANEATELAARLRRELAQALRDEGLPMRDVGRLIGVSHQRVHQLLAS